MERDTDTPKGTPRAVGMRVIVTAVAVALIAGAVLGLGSLGERNTRRLLTRELETRLLSETRSLALLGASALLSDFPELTLHPLVKELSARRPDVALAVVVDLHGVVQGHPDAEKLGTAFSLDRGLHASAPSIPLEAGETLRTSDNLLVAESPIRHPNGEPIGTAIVALDRSHIETALLEARSTQRGLLATILALAVVVTLVVMSVLLRPISVLRSGLERVGSGDFDFRLDISSRTELGVLARTINDVAARLKSAQHDLLEKERLAHEMQLARQIQQSLLPAGSVASRDFTVAGVQRAADEVGGDYYNVFTLDDERVAVVIADVAGKGLAGCLVTSMIDVLVRTLSPSHTSPAALIVALEERLRDSLQPGTFVTMFYGTLDAANGRLTFASAGHNPLLHYRAAAGRVDSYRTNGVPVGLVGAGALARTLEDRAIVVDPGDVLVASTDGFNEALDPGGAEYGFANMEEVLRRHGKEGCDAVIHELQESVAQWEGPSPAADDKTLLAIARAWAPTRAVPEYVNRLWTTHGAHSQHYSMPATLESLDGIGSWIAGCTVLEDLPEPQLGLLESGLYEICANIAEHGCMLDRNKSIDVWWIPASGPWDPGRKTTRRASNDVVGYFLIRDDGSPPDQHDWSTPDIDSPRTRREGRGLGLAIIQRVLKRVELHANTEVGNITLIEFEPSQGQPV